MAHSRIAFRLLFFAAFLFLFCFSYGVVNCSEELIVYFDEDANDLAKSLIDDVKYILSVDDVRKIDLLQINSYSRDCNKYLLQIVYVAQDNLLNLIDAGCELKKDALLNYFIQLEKDFIVTAGVGDVYNINKIVSLSSIAISSFFHFSKIADLFFGRYMSSRTIRFLLEYIQMEKSDRNDSIVESLSNTLKMFLVDYKPALSSTDSFPCNVEDSKKIMYTCKVLDDFFKYRAGLRLDIPTEVIAVGQPDEIPKYENNVLSIRTFLEPHYFKRYLIVKFYKPNFIISKLTDRVDVFMQESYIVGEFLRKYTNVVEENKVKDEKKLVADIKAILSVDDIKNIKLEELKTFKKFPNKDVLTAAFVAQNCLLELIKEGGFELKNDALLNYFNQLVTDFSEKVGYNMDPKNKIVSLSSMAISSFFQFFKLTNPFSNKLKAMPTAVIVFLRQYIKSGNSTMNDSIIKSLDNTVKSIVSDRALSDIDGEELKKKMFTYTSEVLNAFFKFRAGLNAYVVKELIELGGNKKETKPEGVLNLIPEKFRFAQPLMIKTYLIFEYFKTEFITLSLNQDAITVVKKHLMKDVYKNYGKILLENK